MATLIVPDEIKKETTKCHSNFSCLESDYRENAGLCRVDFAAGKYILFLKSACSDESWTCHYHLLYGNGSVCFCPVHHYLYLHQKNQNIHENKKPDPENCYETPS